MRHKLHSLLTNPWTLILPLAALMIVGWQHYTHVGLALSTPADGVNMLPNGDFAQFDSSGVPLGWELQASGANAYETEHSDGYAGGSAFRLKVTGYKNGEVMFVSPKVNVKPHETYLYKGYYRSNEDFAFLAHYYYADGTDKLVYLKDYRDVTGTWSTVSDAFDAGDTIVAVQYAYKLTSNSQLEVNGVYLEPKQQVYIQPAVSGDNIIPNRQLVVDTDTNMPSSWSPYSSGSSTSDFTYESGATENDVRIVVHDYKNGEAKWEFVPLDVASQQYYWFGVSYQSDVAANIVAEYVMVDGQRQFVTLSTLVPAKDWTAAMYPFEVPVGAQTMTVSVVLNSNGTLATREYSLQNATKPGEAHWKRPLVSIAFDDGWESAFTLAVPELKQRNLKATFYINPSSIETPAFMTADDLVDLSNAGNEIAAHGYAHDDMTAIDEGALDYQLHEGRDYLRKAGFTVQNFATPYGNSDPEVQWYARQYFDTLRSTQVGINTRQNLDPYNLQILYMDTSVSKAALAAALQQTRLTNGWLILVYHRLGAVITPRTVRVEDTTVSTKDFVTQVNLVKQSGVTEMPIGAAYSEVHKQ